MSVETQLATIIANQEHTKATVGEIKADTKSLLGFQKTTEERLSAGAKAFDSIRVNMESQSEDIREQELVNQQQESDIKTIVKTTIPAVEKKIPNQKWIIGAIGLGFVALGFLIKLG